MSGGTLTFTTDQAFKTHAEAYPLSQREAHAEQAVAFAAAGQWLDNTSCWHICRTYNVPHLLSDLKALRAKFRTELSMVGGDK
jgi:hypothetical protein